MIKPRRRLEIPKVVAKLLELGEIDRPPVPVERIARLRGAQVRYEPFEGEMSGLLYRDPDTEEIIIGINALHSKTRQRFTIAHELGHLEIHASEPFRVDRNFRILFRDARSGQAVDPAEIQANTFAAELLMPRQFLLSDLVGQAVDYEDDELLRRLADRYKVSLQAMTFRLANLGLMRMASM